MDWWIGWIYFGVIYHLHDFSLNISIRSSVRPSDPAFLCLLATFVAWSTSLPRIPWIHSPRARYKATRPWWRCFQPSHPSPRSPSTESSRQGLPGCRPCIPKEISVGFQQVRIQQTFKLKLLTITIHFKGWKPPIICSEVWSRHPQRLRSNDQRHIWAAQHSNGPIG